MASVLCSLLLLLSPLSVMAEPTATAIASGMIITEVQTGSTSASDEFIELYNASDASVDITGWQVRHLNAGGSGDATTLLATVVSSGSAPVVLPSGDYYVIHSSGIAIPDGVAGQVYAASLSAADKTIALFARDAVTCQMTAVDAVAWESVVDTTMGEGSAVEVGAGSADEEKLLQRQLDGSGHYVDTDNNSSDFVSVAASPGADNSQYAIGSTDTGTPSSLPSFAASDCTIPDPDDGSGQPPAGEDQESPRIVELLPNPQGTDTNSEFIEVHNPNNEAFDLSGYVLEAGLTTKYRYTLPPATVLSAGEYRAFSSVDTKVTLSNTSGQVRLIDASGAVISECDPYGSAPEAQAWVFIGGLWQWSTELTPGVVNDVPSVGDDGASEDDAETPPVTDPDDDAEPAGEVPENPTVNAGLASPQLTELLPNPGSPQTDAEDEFIELYNPNDTSFDLSGYVIEVGTTTKHRYIIAQGVSVASHNYLAFFSADTGLALSNTGGQVRLIDLQESTVSQTDVYGTAKDNQSWMIVNGVWQWTAQPTPNAANVIGSVGVLTAASKKSAAVKKAAKAKTTSAAKAKSTKSAPKTDVGQLVASTPSDTPLHPGVLALIGVSALLYGAYEYRRDVANKFHQFRSDRAARRAARQIAEGR